MICEPKARHRRIEEKATLIIVKTALTEPNTALAGAMPEISFARFRDSTAMFNEERTLSCPFGRWDPVTMARTRGDCKRVVWEAGCEEELGPNIGGRPFWHDTTRANDSATRREFRSWWSGCMRSTDHLCSSFCQPPGFSLHFRSRLS